MDLIDFNKSFIEKADTVIENFLKKISTFNNNAQPELLHHIKVVDCYGEKTIIKNIANIVAIDNLTISIKPWVATNIKNIEKGIATNNNLELNTKPKGNELYVTFPLMSQERRNTFAKNIKSIAEESKVLLRKIRNDLLNLAKIQEKEKILNKDNIKKISEKITKITQDYVKNIDFEATKKSKSLGATT